MTDELREMLDEGVGDTGFCTSCSKERDRVRGQTCLDCRIHYGQANELDRIVAAELDQQHRDRIAPLHRMVDRLDSVSKTATRLLDNVRPFHSALEVEYHADGEELYGDLAEALGFPRDYGSDSYRARVEADRGA